MRARRAGEDAAAFHPAGRCSGCVGRTRRENAEQGRVVQQMTTARRKNTAKLPKTLQTPKIQGFSPPKQ